MNDIYICLTLKVADPEQIAIILTTWANKGFCYKLSFPVFNESFTASKRIYKYSRVSNIPLRKFWDWKTTYLFLSG